MVHLAGKKMNLGKFVFRPMTQRVRRRRRIDPGPISEEGVAIAAFSGMAKPPGREMASRVIEH